MPMTPPPPPYTFRFKFADDALVLKHPVQNFALGEAASFVQRGVLHFLVAFALALAAFAMINALESNWLRMMTAMKIMTITVKARQAD